MSNIQSELIKKYMASNIWGTYTCHNISDALLFLASALDGIIIDMQKREATDE